ncbi:olfactory receptor 11A1-like [Leptodactylus fuscus]|uniref:olfactory receptor 11A1-like n=1 Tax=Leptodactylus fuscus TaxID=238119 RepID=UPI003F4EE351
MDCGRTKAPLVVTKDASLWGCGAHLGSLDFKGLWFNSQLLAFSNLKIEAFSLIWGHHVKILSNNKTMVAYLIRYVSITRIYNFSLAPVSSLTVFLSTCYYQSSILLEKNLTAVKEFFLLGFQGGLFLSNALFLVFFLVYVATICGNLLIITLVSTSKILHTPMYFFISQLSISDILLTSEIAPNMLHVLLKNGGTITYVGCMTQYYFFCVVEVFECLLLSVMSYDRYVAICNPLRYNTIMTSTCSMILGITCWLFGFAVAFIDIVMALMLNFCGPNIIDHFYCDLVPLLEIACSDTYIVQLEISILSVPAAFIPTIIIVISYVKIVSVVLRIPSSTGRQKAFSTCSSHLMVVSIFFCTLFSVYVLPMGARIPTISKLISLLYTVFTPLINPIIYSLRNRDIKKAIEKSLYKCVKCEHFI